LIPRREITRTITKVTNIKIKPRNVANEAIKSTPLPKCERIVIARAPKVIPNAIQYNTNVARYIRSMPVNPVVYCLIPGIDAECRNQGGV
jgi:hypothetical protein